MSVTIRPIRDQVLCRPVKHKPPVTESGVEGAPDAKDQFPIARVIAAGPDCKYLQGGELVQIAEVEAEQIVGGEVQAWTCEPKIRCIVEGEDPANLIEGITEEAARARLEQLRADAEIKRKLMVGSTAPTRGHVYVDGRRHH